MKRSEKLEPDIQQTQSELTVWRIHFLCHTVPAAWLCPCIQSTADHTINLQQLPIPAENVRFLSANKSHPFWPLIRQWQLFFSFSSCLLPPPPPDRQTSRHAMKTLLSTTGTKSDTQPDLLGSVRLCAFQIKCSRHRVYHTVAEEGARDHMFAEMGWTRVWHG